MAWKGRQTPPNFLTPQPPTRSLGIFVFAKTFRYETAEERKAVARRKPKNPGGKNAKQPADSTGDWRDRNIKGGKRRRPQPYPKKESNGMRQCPPLHSKEKERHLECQKISAAPKKGKTPKRCKLSRSQKLPAAHTSPRQRTRGRTAPQRQPTNRVDGKPSQNDFEKTRRPVGNACLPNPRSHGTGKAENQPQHSHILFLVQKERASLNTTLHTAAPKPCHFTKRK